MQSCESDNKLTGIPRSRNMDISYKNGFIDEVMMGVMGE